MDVPEDAHDVQVHVCVRGAALGIHTMVNEPECYVVSVYYKMR